MALLLSSFGAITFRNNESVEELENALLENDKPQDGKDFPELKTPS